VEWIVFSVNDFLKKTDVSLIFSSLVVMMIMFMVPMNDIQEIKFSSPHNTPYEQFYFDKLGAEKNYFNRNCGDSTSFENRKKFRWLFYSSQRYMLKISYNYIGSRGAAVIYSMWHAVLATLTFLFIVYNIRFILSIDQVSIDSRTKQFVVFLSTILFLIYILYITNGALSEYTFSLHEMFLLSLALYCVHRRYIVLFILTVCASVLVRESGFLIVLLLLFSSNYRYLLYAILSALLVYLYVNFDVFHCLSDPEYMVNAEKQIGQLTWHTFLNGYIGFMKGLWAVLYNFVPFVATVVLSYKYLYLHVSNNASVYNMYLGLFAVYVGVFFVATPLHHMSVKLLLLPLMIPLGVIAITNVYFLKHSE